MQCARKADVSRMLVVGDRQSIAAIVGRFEESPKWDISFAEPAEDLAAILHDTRYDVVLLHLPDDSPELTPIRMLRAVNPEIKIILFVERATTAHIVAAIRAHVFSFFSRPYDVEDACHMIATAAALSDWTNGIEVLSATPAYLTLRLRCTLHTADRLVQFMKEVPVELPPDDLQDTAHAFRELLLNAIEHGGKLDANEWVRVSRIRTLRTLVYHIVDPGDGFSSANLAHAAISAPDDPVLHLQAREQLGCRPGGFGMLIATRMVDEVIYNEQGNQVILIKHLD